MKVCKQKEREDIKVPNQSDAFNSDLHLHIRNLEKKIDFIFKSPYRVVCTSHSRIGWWSTTGAPDDRCSISLHQTSLHPLINAVDVYLNKKNRLCGFYLWRLVTSQKNLRN